jgi:FkbM family methyltransferase
MFTSYAQNFEDVILWRALKHVENGTYIDIGAQDPIVDSVSLGFYEHGWRGVHVEPVPQYAEKLRRARPDEDVIECVVGSEPGTKTFFSIPGSGLSTAEAENAYGHAAQGHTVERINVRCIPLSELLDSRSSTDIHWLKIDVEGMEKAVLDGWLPSAVRPWIVAIESTLPTSPEVNFSAWEPQLLALGYEYVYFDGLNRFYVHNTHQALKSHFGPGPNVFDGFALSGLASAPFCHKTVTQLVELRETLASRTAEAERQKALAADYLASLKAYTQVVTGLKERVSILQLENEWLHRPTGSWNPLLPLRLTVRVVRSNLSMTSARIFSPVRDITSSAVRRITNSRKLRNIARRGLQSFPAVTARLRTLVTRVGVQNSYRPSHAIAVTSVPPRSGQADTVTALLNSAAQWKAGKRINAQSS